MTALTRDLYDRVRCTLRAELVREVGMPSAARRLSWMTGVRPYLASRLTLSMESANCSSFSSGSIFLNSGSVTLLQS